MDGFYTKALQMSYLAWLAYATKLTEISSKLQTSNLEGLQNYQVIDILKDASEHFGFVAMSRDEIVIAIRGTLSVKDWAYNLLVPRVNDEFHLGFQLYTEPIWKQLQAILPPILTDKIKVITTGHSLGGASATLLAHKLNNLEFKDKFLSLETYTFGAPPLGSENIKLDTPLYRFRTPGDLVPHLPWLGSCIVEMLSNKVAWVPQVQQPLSILGQTLAEYCHPEPEYLLHSTGQIYKLDASQVHLQMQQSEFLRVFLETLNHGTTFAEITSKLFKISQFQGNIQLLISDIIGGYLNKIIEPVLIEHSISRYTKALDIEMVLPKSLFLKSNSQVSPEISIANEIMTSPPNSNDSEIASNSVPISEDASVFADDNQEAKNKNEESEESQLVVTSEAKPVAKKDEGNWWGGMFEAVTGAVGGAANAVGGSVAGAAGAVGSAVGGTVVGAAGVVGGAVGSAANTVGGAVIGAAGVVGGAVGSAANTVGGAVVGAAGSAGGAVVGGVSLATSSAGSLLQVVQAV